MFNNEDYIKWGKELFEKAKKIHRYEIAHKVKIVQIIEDFREMYDLSDEIANNLTNIQFRSFAMKGYFPGPEEVKDYWIAYTTKSPYNYQLDNWENSIRRMIEGPFNYGIINDFKESHFDDDGKFNLSWGGDKKINIRVPCALNYYEVKYAINVIEKLTNCTVTKISLWYFTHDISHAEMVSEVVLAFDDQPNKHKDCPFIIREKFLNHKFSSFENWYKEISEFKNYISEIDNNTVKCLSCGESIYNSDGTAFWCSLCKHYLDREGNCASRNCESCKKDDSQVFNEGDLPF